MAGPVANVEVYVAIISAGRPGNVPLMEGHLGGFKHQWVVPTGQAEEYRYAGAQDVTECHSTQDTHQRNHALRIAGTRWCVQIDDDLRRIQFAMPGEKVRPFTVTEAIGLLIKACEVNDAYYSGIAPTDNAYFTRQMFTLDGFIRSALTCYRPVFTSEGRLMYDDQFPLKGDYDLTCQHLERYGKVARVDSILGSFAYGQGHGGCVEYRTPELEQEVIQKLMAKWPGAITPNPKREGEVRLRWRNRATVEPVAGAAAGELSSPLLETSPATVETPERSEQNESAEQPKQMGLDELW